MGWAARGRIGGARVSDSILVAGIGNIFHRDDAFGVFVAAKLAAMPLAPNVRVVDYGIRGIDLAFALLDPYSLTILVDAVSRGGEPGALYAIEPDLNSASGDVFEGAHGLDPVKVLAMAKSLGAPLGRVVVVGCEPQSLESEAGTIGLSEPVQAAVDPAIAMIRSFIDEARTKKGVN
jgi:hydrogenase maturation protease